MVPDMTERRVTMLFVEGLSDRLHGLVKAHKLSTLHDAIGLALDLETTPPVQPHKFFSGSQSKQKNFKPQKNFSSKIDQESRNELRRKKLCFNCKEPWELAHRCLGKGKVHLIEVIYEDEEQEEQDPSTDEDSNQGDQPQIELEDSAVKETPRIVTLFGVPRSRPFRLKGVLKGQRMVCLVDSGATHNFIDEGLVMRRGLQVEEFPGFSVIVADGFSLTCTKVIPQLSIQFGD